MTVNDSLIENNDLYKDPSKSFTFALRAKKLPFWIEKDFLTFYTVDYKAQKFILGSRLTYHEVNKAYLYALYMGEITKRAHIVIKEYLKKTLQDLKEKWSFSELEEINGGKYAEIIISVELTDNREAFIRNQPLLQPPPQS